MITLFRVRIDEHTPPVNVDVEKYHGSADDLLLTGALEILTVKAAERMKTKYRISKKEAHGYHVCTLSM